MISGETILGLKCILRKYHDVNLQCYSGQLTGFLDINKSLIHKEKQFNFLNS